MPTFGSTTPLAQTDGILYASAVPITTTEATLNGGTGVQSLDPFATTFNEAIVATVVLTMTGIATGASTYVVMQMDMGDGVWVDMNWCFWDGKQGSATFVFSNGVAGANSFQQSRQSGAVPTPQANGSNQMALGGRIRFVGQSRFVGGSSTLAGTTAAVSATIRYRLLPLR